MHTARRTRQGGGALHAMSLTTIIHASDRVLSMHIVSLKLKRLYCLHIMV